MSRQEEPKDKLLSQLQKDWKQLDELGSPPVPSVDHLKEQLVTVKMQKKRAFQKELILFIVTALFILTAFITAAFQAPLIFIVTQISALAVAPIVFYFLTKRKQEGSILS